MKRSRFSEEQSIHYRQRIAKQSRQRGILKERQASIGVKELCRKHGISDGAF